MERRKFLKLTGLAGTALIAIPSFGYTSTSTKEAAVGIIKNESKALGLMTSTADIKQFVEDYYKDNKISESFRYQLKVKSYYYFGVSADMSYTVSELVKNFLMSTDFFNNKMDPRKPIKYTGIYSPYKKPCANPFSYFHYPAQTV